MIVTMSAEKPRAATSKLVNTRFIGRSSATPTATSNGATNSPIWVLEPRAMVSARSVCPRWAATTAVACSAALPTRGITIRPRNSCESPNRVTTASVACTSSSLSTNERGRRRQDRDRYARSARRAWPRFARPRPLAAEQLAVGHEREHEARDIGESEDERHALGEVQRGLGRRSRVVHREQRREDEAHDGE